MQKPIQLFMLFALISGIFTSCKNEVDIAADWKEIAVVYGLLNPTDDVQYLRIQRAFLDENIGAMKFADEPDSFYFDTLEVFISEYRNGLEINSYKLERVDGNLIGLPKDSGAFQNKVNYLYRLDKKIHASTFLTDYSYNLTIFNPRTGYTVKASTTSLGRAEVDAPVSELSDNLIVLANEGFVLAGAFQEGKYVRAYDMMMRIRVEEIDLSDTLSRETIEMDWIMFRDRKTNSLRGFDDAAHRVPGSTFFSFIASQLDSTKNVKRRLMGFDLFTIGSSLDLYTFINVNEPSIGIVQKKPEYTNIENGYGLFSSRHIDKFIDKHFDPRTKEAMTVSDKTKHLHFVNY